jgi:hypothetical protein
VLKVSAPLRTKSSTCVYRKPIFSPRLMQQLNQRTSCVATDDFFNTIDPKRTLVGLRGPGLRLFPKPRPGHSFLRRR